MAEAGVKNAKQYILLSPLLSDQFSSTGSPDSPLETAPAITEANLQDKGCLKSLRRGTYHKILGRNSSSFVSVLLPKGMLDIKLSQNWQPEALSPLSLKEDAGMASLLNKKKRLLYSGEELKYDEGSTTLLIPSAEMKLILATATVFTPNGRSATSPLAPRNTLRLSFLIHVHLDESHQLIFTLHEAPAEKHPACIACIYVHGMVLPAK